MTPITISISDERSQKLRDLASQAGTTPEEFLARCVEHMLGQPDERFSAAAERVLNKNHELYRRLA